MPEITEHWLREHEFKWSQLERQPSKHWTLWIGDACGKGVSFEDLGVEIAEGVYREGEWFCWLRADYAGRYSRFLHVRHLRTTEEIELLIGGLIGRPFDWGDAMYGSLRSPEVAASLRRDRERPDWRIMESVPWNADERDPSRAVSQPQEP